MENMCFKSKSIRLCALLFVASATMFGCSDSEYDDTELRNSINNLSQKPPVVSIGFESNDVFYCSETDCELTIVMPEAFKETDYTAMTATIVNEVGYDIDISTRGAAIDADGKWNVKLTQPTFTNGLLNAGSAKVTITLPRNKTHYKALLRVTLIDAKSQEHTASRIVWFKADGDGNVIDNTSGALASKVRNAANVTQLSVIGNMNEDDFQYIRDEMKSLEILDLSRTTLTELPTRALGFYMEQDYEPNTTLETVILPESLEKIGWAAFGLCKKLTYINIPESVNEITDWAFDSTNLTSIDIPSGVTTLGAGAFNQCTSLTSVTIPSGITVLNEMLFYLCENLKHIEWHDNITSIGDDAFCNCLLTGTLILPSGVTEIGKRAFSGTYISSIEFPEGLKTIKSAAFYNIYELTEVTLPASLETLADGAFFWYQDKLKKITFLGVVPPAIMYATNGYTGELQKPNLRYMKDCKVFVPADAVDAYKASLWGVGSDEYGSHIQYFDPANIQAIM